MKNELKAKRLKPKASLALERTLLLELKGKRLKLKALFNARERLTYYVAAFSFPLLAFCFTLLALLLKKLNSGVT